MSVKIVSLVLFAFVIVNQSLGAPNKSKGNLSCPDQLKEVDRIFKVLLLMNKRRLVASDEAKHTQYCKEITSLGKKVARYSKCEKAFAAQVLTILSNGVKKPIKYVCNEQKQASIANFACMTDAFLDQVNEKEAYLVKNLKYVSKNATSADALPLFCCTLVDYFDNLSKLQSPKCSSKSSDASKFVHQRQFSGSADVIDLVCSSYKTVKTCEEKNGPMMSILRTPPPKGFSIDEEEFANYFIGAVTRMI